MSYTTKIGELATRYTWHSIFLYDDDYRFKQWKHGFRWGSDSSHLSTVILEERKTKQEFSGNAEKTTSSSKSGGYKSTKNADTSHDSEESRPKFCNVFNDGKDCRFHPCKFKHACSGCGKAHAKVHHDIIMQSSKTPV